MSRIESFPIDLGDSYEKVLNSCGLDEYDQNSVIITRNRVLEEIRSSIHQRRGNSLKSTMLDLKAYTTDYAKQQCDDLQEQLKELSDEKDVLKKDNDKKDKRVSECNAKITELESYYYKYITLCDYIVRINANPVREVITETIMRYSKKGKIKDSDHTFTGEVREILIALIRDEFRDYSLSNDNVSHEALYEKINMNIDFEATYTYVSNKDFQISLFRVYSINSMDSQSPQICQMQKNWIQSLKRHSTLISGSGEAQRIAFLEKQKSFIETL